MKNSRGPLGPTIAIALGAGVEHDGTPTERTIARAEAAALLANANPDLTVILTGDGRTGFNRRRPSRSEASHMARILQMKGIARERLQLEHQACDTIGNAILVAARFLSGETPRKTYIVTSPFHGERALVLFRGVLGPAWPIELFASAVAAGDEIKAPKEAGGIEWAHRFFEGTTGGDLSSQIDRLLAVGKPRYRTLRWLKEHSSAA